MKIVLAVAVMTIFLSTVFGQDADIGVPQVGEAEARCEKAIENAENVERNAEAQALTDLLAILEKAATNEVKTNRFQMLALDNRIREVKDRLAILTGKRVKMEVVGDKGWQKFGLVVKGQRLHISAKGKWMDNSLDDATRWGPDGRRGDGRWGLIAQIDGKDSFAVGSNLDIVIPKSGTMEFGMADSTHKHGSGKLEVTIVLVN